MTTQFDNSFGFKFNKNLKRIRRKCFFGVFLQLLLISKVVLTHSDVDFDSLAKVTVHVDEELYFEVLDPEEISFTFKITSANDFGTRFNSTIKSVPLVPANPLHLCTNAINAASLSENIALAQRGDCSFVTKTINAEKAGVRAIVIMDSDITNDADIISMQDDETGRMPYIPAVFIFGKDGYMILKTLERLKLDRAIINIPVNMTGVPIHKRNLPKWNVW